MKTTTLALLLSVTAASAADNPISYVLEVLIEARPNHGAHNLVSPATAENITANLRDYRWQDHLGQVRVGWPWSFCGSSDFRIYNTSKNSDVQLELYRSGLKRSMAVAIAGPTNAASYYLFYGQDPGKYTPYPRYIEIAKLDEVIAYFTKFAGGEIAALDKLFTDQGKEVTTLPREWFGVIPPQPTSRPLGLQGGVPFLTGRLPAPPGAIQTTVDGLTNPPTIFPPTNGIIVPAPKP